MSKKTAQNTFNGLRLNLLYPQGSEKKFYVNFLHWLVTYGRFIIIVVELVVLVAFGLRFSYDAQLADLKDKIKKQSELLENYIVDEPRIIQLQKKLEFIKKSQASNPNWTLVFTELGNEMPPTVKITSLSIDQDAKAATPNIQFRIAAQTASINDLGFFLKNLRGNKTFKEITLQNLSIEQGQVIFNIAGGVVK
jgi:Tfp pilus assembly protein PilN